MITQHLKKDYWNLFMYIIKPIAIIGCAGDSIISICRNDMKPHRAAKTFGGDFLFLAFILTHQVRTFVLILKVWFTAPSSLSNAAGSRTGPVFRSCFCSELAPEPPGTQSWHNTWPPSSNPSVLRETTWFILPEWIITHLDLQVS